eukprot:4722957-Pyramimonas_sp.AAC.1
MSWEPTMSMCCVISGTMSTGGIVRMPRPFELIWLMWPHSHARRCAQRSTNMELWNITATIAEPRWLLISPSLEFVLQATVLFWRVEVLSDPSLMPSALPLHFMAMEAVVTLYHVALGLSRPHAQNLICYVAAVRSTSCWSF